MGERMDGDGYMSWGYMSWWDVLYVFHVFDFMKSLARSRSRVFRFYMAISGVLSFSATETTAFR